MRNNIARDLQIKSTFPLEKDFGWSILTTSKQVCYRPQDRTFARSTAIRVNIWRCYDIGKRRHGCFMLKYNIIVRTRKIEVPTGVLFPNIKYAEEEQWHEWLEDFGRLSFAKVNLLLILYLIFMLVPVVGGEIRVEGPATIPLQPIYDALQIEPGNAYHISDLYQAQQRIYQLQLSHGLFRTIFRGIFFSDTIPRL